MPHTGSISASTVSATFASCLLLRALSSSEDSPPMQAALIPLFLCEVGSAADHRLSLRESRTRSHNRRCVVGNPGSERDMGHPGFRCRDGSCRLSALQGSTTDVSPVVHALELDSA